ncbi:hypothetical protein VBD025_01255 [Virgibacillus flavescens]|uniref:hypothetical protein n=1 Tax=Virgibacillus flavescens TaxID=1611422 RepID=UPI003D34E2A0
MELKNIFKTAGVGVLSIGVLAGCAGGEESSAEDEYLTDNDVEQFYTEEELNTWAEDNGLLEEGNAGADAEEPDLDEEPSEEQGNAGADAEEPDLDEEPAEENSTS